MPIYEFLCDGCHEEFEVIAAIGQSFVVCPICDEYTSHRIMSSLGIIENFEDYYETDIDNKPVYIRTKQDLRDSVARHNDGKEADMMGPLAIFDGIRSDKIIRR